MHCGHKHHTSRNRLPANFSILFSCPYLCNCSEFERREFFITVSSLSIDCFAHLCGPTCVYIYIWQLSSIYRAPMSWFIDLTVANCHILYTFLSLYQFFSQENGQNTKILEVSHSLFTIQKCPPTVTRHH